MLFTVALVEKPEAVSRLTTEQLQKRSDVGENVVGRRHTWVQVQITQRLWFFMDESRRARQRQRGHDQSVEGLQWDLSPTRAAGLSLSYTARLLNETFFECDLGHTYQARLEVFSTVVARHLEKSRRRVHQDKVSENEGESNGQICSGWVFKRFASD
jgi:hypothetical protein